MKKKIEKIIGKKKGKKKPREREKRKEKLEEKPAIINIVKKKRKKETIGKILPIKKILDIIPDYSSIVRKKREELNLSQDELALMIKEKKSVVHRIETNELKPSLFLARKLEKALNIKLIEEVEE